MKRSFVKIKDRHKEKKVSKTNKKKKEINRFHTIFLVTIIPLIILEIIDISRFCGHFSNSNVVSNFTSIAELVITGLMFLTTYNVRDSIDNEKREEEVENAMEHVLDIMESACLIWDDTDFLKKLDDLKEDSSSIENPLLRMLQKYPFYHYEQMILDFTAQQLISPNLIYSYNDFKHRFAYEVYHYIQADPSITNIDAKTNLNQIYKDTLRDFNIKRRKHNIEDKSFEDKLILVDIFDNEIGDNNKLKVHEIGALHRAFSVFVVHDGKMLLQKRNPSKYHSGNLWTNACCSHPRKGESIELSVKKRLKDELGVTFEVEEIFDFTYRAEFDNGITEYEYDHVFVADYDGAIYPNPEEIIETRWISFADLANELTQSPQIFTAWFIIAAPKVLLKMKERGLWDEKAS